MKSNFSKFAALAAVVVTFSLTQGAFGQGQPITNPLDTSPVTGADPQIANLKKVAAADEKEAQEVAAQRNQAYAKVQRADTIINNYNIQATKAYQDYNSAYDAPSRARYSARYRACHSQVVSLTVVRGVAQSEFDHLTRRVDYLYQVVAELRTAVSYSYRELKAMEAAAAKSGMTLTESIEKSAAMVKKLEAADASLTPPATAPGTTPPAVVAPGTPPVPDPSATPGATPGTPPATAPGTPPAVAPGTTPPAAVAPGTTPPATTTPGTPPATSTPTTPTAKTAPAVVVPPIAPSGYVIDWLKTFLLVILIGVLIALAVGLYRRTRPTIVP